MEVKRLKNLKKKLKYQLLSQAIVNGFFTFDKHKSFRNQLIPSFFVTEKYIRVVLYHIELDISSISAQLKLHDVTDPDRK